MSFNEFFTIYNTNKHGWKDLIVLGMCGMLTLVIIYTMYTNSSAPEMFSELTASTGSDKKVPEVKKANEKFESEADAAFDAPAILDLLPLSALSRLTCLIVEKLHGVSCMMPLASLTRLQALSCKDMRTVTDWSALSTLVDLRHLNLSWTPVHDVRLLSCLTRLQTLSCYKTTVADFGSLEVLSMLQDLRCLDISGVSAVLDLRPISTLKRLELLYCLPQPPLRLTDDDVAPLEALTGLRELDYRGYYISPTLASITCINVLGQNLRDIFSFDE